MKVPPAGQFSSASYWEDRYVGGGNSGAGSRGSSARFKADFVNSFVEEHGIETVVEYGCGDGGQLALAEYPLYVGVDVSEKALDLCRKRFAGDETKSFFTSLLFPPTRSRFDLSLSMDVTYHLIEDDVYERYLQDLFAASHKWVILFTSDIDDGEVTNDGTAAHVHHRPVATDIALRFDLMPEITPGVDGCWFYVYELPS